MSSALLLSWQAPLRSFTSSGPHIIEASEDLMHWTTIHTGTPTGGILQFTDAAGQSQGHKFHRVRVGM